MHPVLQDALPAEMQTPAPLPGMGPCAPADWLRVDEAYDGQMRERARLLADHSAAVLWAEPAAMEACAEVLAEALQIAPALGFSIQGGRVRRPDGQTIDLQGVHPLATMGALFQEDICILQKRGEEHVLAAALVCFPASWRLADKVGRPLSVIHKPVPEYDANITKRVQRFFDGVRVGQPLWRFNRLSYALADLHQPARITGGDGHFLRAERQCVVRMPRTQAVVFSIHTYVVDADGQPGQ